MLQSSEAKGASGDIDRTEISRTEKYAKRLIVSRIDALHAERNRVMGELFNVFRGKDLFRIIGVLIYTIYIYVCEGNVRERDRDVLYPRA